MCREREREQRESSVSLGNIPPSVVCLLLLSASNPIIDDKKGNRTAETAAASGSSFVPSEGVSHIKRRRREREDRRFY